MIEKCVFSPCQRYRYTLRRRWDWLSADDYALFICLNPSTADDTKDDPTIRRCIGFAKRWGMGGMAIANLFAYRSTNPNALYDLGSDESNGTGPVGIDNNFHIQQLAINAKVVVAAWGRHGKLLRRGDAVRAMLANHSIALVCLAVNKDGSPKHPLYVPYDIPVLAAYA